MPSSFELYSVEKIRNIENAAFNEVSEESLMRKAGLAAFELMQEQLPDLGHITVLCGSGNNGGDGLVLARLALDEGLDVVVLTLGNFEGQSETAKMMLQEVSDVDVSIKPYENIEDLRDTDLIIDAMLGIGLEGEVREPYKQVIADVNAVDIPVLALDVPSGLSADTGSPWGSAVIADVTITFIGYKQGLVTGQGKYYCGDLYLDKLGLDEVLDAHDYSGLKVGPSILSSLIPVPVEYVHKGMMGHIAILGGDHGMPGAVAMAAEAALRVGAGKVTIVTRERNFPIVMSARSEFICLAVENDFSPLDDLLDQVDVCVVGPGMTTSEWSEQIFKYAIQFNGPKVIDAGALMLLSATPHFVDKAILTPHPGEAGYLLSTTPDKIEDDRYLSACKIVEKYAEIVVLKGAGSIIQSKISERTYVCNAGNSGMATAGMGDILAGMIGGLAAQCDSIEDAAVAGTVLHAHCGDLAASKIGTNALLAGDMFDFFGAAFGADNYEWVLEEAF